MLKVLNKWGIKLFKVLGERKCIKRIFDIIWVYDKIIFFPCLISVPKS
jgi:hypothetical protein